MTSEAWFKLRRGSLIRSINGRTTRKVLRARNGCITLKMVKSGRWRLWSGHLREGIAGKSTTTYVSCDKYMFKVVRY